MCSHGWVTKKIKYKKVDTFVMKKTIIYKCIFCSLERQEPYFYLIKAPQTKANKVLNRIKKKLGEM